MLRSANSPTITNGASASKLNLFQRLVRQWEELHPYNGVQLLKIRGRADLDLSRQAWHDGMEVLGLGRVNVVGDSYSYHLLNGESAQYSVVQCPVGTAMEDLVSAELNRPFDANDAVPFRPFVIQEKDSFWMGLCYQHWIADSESIRMLMKEWFVRQFDPAAATDRPVRHRCDGFTSLFGPHRPGWQTCDALLSSVRWQSQFYRARRVEDPEKFKDMTARFVPVTASTGMIDGLRASARKMGVTVNDFILAAIAEACNLYVPVPRRYRHQDLAVGSIVDLRSRIGQPMHDVFDLLLGFTSVICRPKHLDKWDTLLRTVHAQTRRQKLCGTLQASWIRMMGAWLAGRMLPRERMFDFYRKRVALAGANSNVNANQSWLARYHPDVIQLYLRAAPTGPMTPLVLSTTTLGQELGIGLTYRPAILPAGKSVCFINRMMDRLSSLACGKECRAEVGG